jgi:hypothetical protein
LEGSFSFTAEQQNTVAQEIEVSIKLSLLIHLRNTF